MLEIYTFSIIYIFFLTEINFPEAYVHLALFDFVRPIAYCSKQLLWERHNLFAGRSPIILGGRREKGMYLFFFKYFYKLFLIIWLELSLFDLWLFCSFYLCRSSAENLVERDFLIRILFQVYFDFA